MRTGITAACLALALLGVAACASGLGDQRSRSTDAPAAVAPSQECDPNEPDDDDGIGGTGCSNE